MRLPALDNNQRNWLAGSLTKLSGSADKLAANG